MIVELTNPTESPIRVASLCGFVVNVAPDASTKVPAKHKELCMRHGLMPAELLAPKKAAKKPAKKADEVA